MMLATRTQVSALIVDRLPQYEPSATAFDSTKSYLLPGRFSDAP